MPAVTIVEHNGRKHLLEASCGTSIMQVAMDNMVEGIVAECGGGGSCATCHCYIDPDWSDRAGELSGIEKDMLDMVLEPQANSRLSCQVIMTDDLDGLVVRLPAAQF